MNSEVSQKPLYAVGTVVNQQTISFPIYSGMVANYVPYVTGLDDFKQFADPDQIRELYNKMGNKVLRNIEAHETERLGELAQKIHEKIIFLKKEISLTNSQWVQFAELSSSISELIGDPYDPESTDAD